MSDSESKGLRAKTKRLSSSLTSRGSKSEERSRSLNPLEPWTFIIEQSERAKLKSLPFYGPDSIPMGFFSAQDIGNFFSINTRLSELSHLATSLKACEATLTLVGRNELSLTSTHANFNVLRGKAELSHLFELLKMLRPEKDGPPSYLRQLQSRESGAAMGFSTAPFKDLQELLESLPSEEDLKAALGTSQSA